MRSVRWRSPRLTANSGTTGRGKANQGQKRTGFQSATDRRAGSRPGDRSAGHTTAAVQHRGLRALVERHLATSDDGLYAADPGRRRCCGTNANSIEHLLPAVEPVRAAAEE